MRRRSSLPIRVPGRRWRLRANYRSNYGSSSSISAHPIGKRQPIMSSAIMKSLAVLILGGVAVFAAAQQPLPSAPSAGKVSQPAPSQPQTQPPTSSQTQQQQQTPNNPGKENPPDTTTPAPTKMAPDGAKPGEATPPGT